MGRRVLAFFLGLILGIVLVAGGVIGAIYIAVCVVNVNRVVPNAGNLLGDMASMSLKGIYDEVLALYNQKIGIADENGKYYTLGEFCQKYNINLNQALGKDIPQEVLDMPAFEFFNFSKDENGNSVGMSHALSQIKVSTFPAVLKMFGSENGAFNDTVTDELNKFSVADLFSQEVGIKGVFANIKFADIMPNAFPAQDSDNKLMWAVGQTTIGGALSGVSGSDNILIQLKAGNAFEAIGALEISAIMGESQYVNAILGNDAVVADLIDENGNIRLDEILNGISIGELLGCQKNEITDTTDYAGIDGQNPEAASLVMHKGDVYIKTTDGEHWFEAELDCKEDHTHTADCYAYVWYSTGTCNNNSADHCHDTDDMLKDGAYYPRVTGLYAVLSSLSVADLTSGNDNALMNKIKVLKVSDIISGVEVSGVMSALVDLTIEDLMSGAIDTLYLGEFFNFERKIVPDVRSYDENSIVEVYKKFNPATVAYYVMTNAENKVVISTDKAKWYEGELTCESEHEHNDNCYRYIWLDSDGKVADGIEGKLASKQIADLQNLNEEVQNLTLDDVFGEDIPRILISIKDSKIIDIHTTIKSVYLGELLDYTYEIVCGQEDDENHEHVASCYVWKDRGDNVIDGIVAKLAYKQVGQMKDLQSTVKTFTLRDVLGDDIPDMLKSLADTQIGDMNDSINNMFLGDFLEYTHIIICGQEDDENHEHVAACYAWTDKNGNAVNGMMAKLAANRVKTLSDLQSTVKTFTLKDVLGDDVPDVLKDVENTQIDNLQGAIDNLYLGSAMGYERKIVDKTDYVVLGEHSGTTVVLKKLVPGSKTLYVMTNDVDENGNAKTDARWFEAVFTCTEKHDHNVDCYEYVWYNKGTSEPVSDVAKAFVNRKLNNVSEIFDTLTLKELGISSDDNTILKSIENVPITEIGNSINTVKMGEVLGYAQYYTCDNANVAAHKHTADCAYIWVEECTDNHDTSKVNNHFATEQHYTIDTKQYIEVKGMNAKIACKTIEQMTGNGMTEIAQSLTIGDLIDSGMMSLGDTEAKKTENAYKFSIVFCGNETHKFTETITIPPSILMPDGGTSNQTYTCTLPDYLTYLSTHADTTAQEYWYKCHSKQAGDELTASEIAHRDDWKNMLLSEFISQLLNAF